VASCSFSTFATLDCDGLPTDMNKDLPRIIFLIHSGETDNLTTPLCMQRQWRRHFRSVCFSSQPSRPQHTLLCPSPFEDGSDINMISRRDETAVGIIAFTNTCQGFSGILKQVRPAVSLCLSIFLCLSFSISLSRSSTPLP
jgi:hypothetical protein